jgi:zinc/manganese transport system permease protein
LAHGAEHIKEILVGQILWVSWSEVIKTAIIYSVVGVIHFIFRKQLFSASQGEAHERKFIWDFLFYALFGVVITSSARHAGVLLVFTYLIVPAIIASLFCKTVRGRLFFGWVFGTLLSLLSLSLSHAWDMPAGALIVVVFTGVPMLLLALAPLVKLKRN